MYDILIENASIIDGTASPPFEADLAIEGQNREFFTSSSTAIWLSMKPCTQGHGRGEY